MVLYIDSIEIEGQAGETILEAARRYDIGIPTLCHSEKIKPYGACGLCLVEIEGSSKLMRACATSAADGMKITTNSERIVSARRAALDLLLSDHNGDCVAPCTLACPAQTQCQSYAGMIANGQYDEALRLIMEKIPLPASIGRVCPHPCETACRRKIVEEPISIAQLKWFAAEHGSYTPELALDTGKKVAIIGGGPAGLTSAYFLRQHGHNVKIFDTMPKMGGMLRYGIPEYRLPGAVLDEEIARIERMGVVMCNNVKISGDSGLSELKSRFDAVIVAIGAWKGVSMGIPGEELDGVTDGIEFLRETALNGNYPVGKTALIVGGGNTAMDACRTAVRLGAEEVYVIYRRTVGEMPAEKLEIEEAMEEGVIFKTLANPVEIYGDEHVTGVRLQKMALGEPDASGRRSPVPLEEYEELNADSVFMSIGQKLEPCGFDMLEKTKRGSIAADEITFSSSVPGIFAAGDAINKGADIAINAIAHGKKLAISVNAYLQGVELSYLPPVLSERNITDKSQLPDIETAARQVPSHQSAEQRKHVFEEFVSVYSEEQAKYEASRCLECGCLDFNECRLIKHSNDYGARQSRFPGKKHISNRSKNGGNIIYDPDKCILCGQCVRMCDEVMGHTALGLVGRGFDTLVKPAMGKPLSETDCTECGMCVSVCPTGALTERTALRKPVPLDECVTRTTCGMCSVGCQVDICTFGNCLIRALPVTAEESFGHGLMCKKGRFDIYDLMTDRQSTAQINGRDADINETTESLNRTLFEIIEKHGTDSVAVSLGGGLTNEEITLVKELAVRLKTDVIFTFSGFGGDIHVPEWVKGDERKSLLPCANSAGLRAAGVKDFEEVKHLFNTGKIKGLVSFGETAPDIKTELYVSVDLNIRENGLKPDYFLPLVSYIENSGTFTNFSGDKLTVRQAVKPLPGLSNERIIGSMFLK